MRFYIVTTSPVSLVEEDSGFIGKYLPGFFSRVYSSTELLWVRRELSPELLETHLLSTPCWGRLRFDSKEDAIGYVQQQYCEENTALPIYSCTISSDSHGVIVLGRPDDFPPNAIILSSDELKITSVSLYHQGTNILDIDFSNITANDEEPGLFV